MVQTGLLGPNLVLVRAEHTGIDVLFGGDRGIRLRTVRVVEGTRETVDKEVGTGLEEERHGVSFRGNIASNVWRASYAVQGGAEDIVGPALKEVAYQSESKPSEGWKWRRTNVENGMVGERPRLEERSRVVGILNFQPARVILKQDRTNSIIRVLANAPDLALPKSRGLLRRIVQEPNLVLALSVRLDEVPFGDMGHAHLKRPQEGERALGAVRIVVVQGVSEAWEVGVGQTDVGHAQVVF